MVEFCVVFKKLQLLVELQTFSELRFVTSQKL